MAPPKAFIIGGISFIVLYLIAAVCYYEAYGKKDFENRIDPNVTTDSGSAASIGNSSDSGNSFDPGNSTDLEHFAKPRNSTNLGNSTDTVQDPETNKKPDVGKQDDHRKQENPEKVPEKSSSNTNIVARSLYDSHDSQNDAYDSKLELLFDELTW